MKTLEIDSLTPPETFGDDLADVQQAVCGTPAGGSRGGLRPYVEVAVILFLAGVSQEVLSPQQVADIEKRAFRKLRRHRGIQELHREICGRTQAMA
jgi:hypothetical protein